ncbi:MAG: ketosteroid isomerase-like protein [Acidimicrobiales bacterium]|nr:ketosteroid isomerase-like protein [Acidimicrobiales bacterium]
MSASTVIERFLSAMTAHDWEAMGDCVTDDVHRVGPYGDVYDGRAEYVEFISKLLPTLPGYVMQVDRVTYADGGRLAFAELSETVDGTRTPEALVFELDGDRINHIAIYLSQDGD